MTTATRVPATSEAQNTHDSLEAEIQRLINLGDKDPLVIARKIDKRQDPQWIKDELYALREEIISEIARGRINSQRHSLMTALRKNKDVKKAELLLLGEWVPNAGWKRLGDWTEADLRSRERYYLKISGTASRLAAWCNDCIELMRAEEVPTLGKVKAPLPELAEAEVLAIENGEV
jgi:hypothetical protein